MEANKTVDISVVTPFYKGNQYMERLFRCIRLNAEKASELTVELVLVNDSPDTEILYSKEWVKNFEIQVILNKINVGIQQSRSNGIEAAHGKYIILLDQDDLLEDDAFRTQYDSIGDADVIVANGFDQNPLNYGAIYRSVKNQKMVLERKYYFSIGNMIVTPGQCMVKKSAFPKEWLERSIQNNGSDDLLLWLLMLPPKCKWKINANNIYIHVDTGENVSANFRKMYDSSEEVLDWLISRNGVTKKEIKLFRRRFQMRKMYDGKSKVWKIVAYFLHPDISFDLLKAKLK